MKMLSRVMRGVRLLFLSGYNGSVMVTHTNKREANISQLPPNTIEFPFPLEKKSLSISGYVITIIDVTPYEVKYIISK
ncbi:hypothetical protein F6477_17355 [Photobacterium damselae subsp. damselae]|uniref:hypothetical protein n=1 Tax=Photobacterium damselae TaxID=38293 RepID=UPI001243F7D5|nr:hypothetical protein [Photobacterium damselae]KAB1176587.1 hypothetical protein F6477_17355 [Photobacterium damselae subsp. damselae]